MQSTDNVDGRLDCRMLFLIDGGKADISVNCCFAMIEIAYNICLHQL